MNCWSRLISHCVWGALVLASPLTAFAESAAVIITLDLIPVAGSGRAMFGWEFVPKSTLEVTSLGLYDHRDNGFVADHELGLWDSRDRSTPLVSVTIPKGETAPLVDHFRYVDIPPLELEGDVTYVIAALYATDDYIVSTLNPSGLHITMNPHIEFTVRRSKLATTLVFPEIEDPSVRLGSFGPNLRFSVVGEVFSIGDLTSNGFVDFEDLTVLLANWNKDVTAAEGNLVSADTTPVNFEDLTVLLADWTEPGPVGSPKAALGTEAVPEPSTLLLAAMAALGVSFYRRRRRRSF